MGFIVDEDDAEGEGEPPRLEEGVAEGEGDAFGELDCEGEPVPEGVPRGVRDDKLEGDADDSGPVAVAHSEALAVGLARALAVAVTHALALAVGHADAEEH